MNYARIVTEFRTRAWAVQESTFGSMLELVARWERGEKFSAEEVEVRIRQANARQGFNRDDANRDTLMISGGSSRSGGGRGTSSIVVVIPVVGVISHRIQMLDSISSGGGTSIQKLTSQFRAAMADPTVSAVVFDIDSPGGSVDGVGELAGEIFESRSKKKSIAVANTLAASAAYWLAAAASELVVAPSGMAGSLGVYGSHEDHSKELERQGVKVSMISAGKYKTEANPFEPLSDAARAHIQAMVDDFYNLFVKGVAQYRNDTQQNVRAGYGQGRTLTAQKAVHVNLADRVETLDDVLSRLGVRGLPRSGRGAGLAASARVIRPSLQRRKMELDLLEMGPACGKKPAALRANPDDDDSFCGCDCRACKACTGTGSAKADMSCGCDCEACEACEKRPGAARLSAQGLRLELDMIELGAPMRRGESLESIHRRRRRELDELLL